MKQKQAKKPLLKPKHKWQTGNYSRVQEVRLMQPYQFLLLCKLVETPPMKMIKEFMTHVSGDGSERAQDEGCRTKAIDYFIQCGYGQGFYTESELRQLLKDLDAIGSLWPDDASMKLIERHAKWRDKYHDYWFKKWYRKTRRKP